MKQVCIIIWFFLILDLNGSACNNDSLIRSAKDQMAKMNYSAAMKALKMVEAEDSLHPDMLWLKAEIYLIYGMPEFKGYHDKLRQAGHSLYTDILRIKHLLFIGSEETDGALREALIRYPEHPEFLFCRWLQALQSGEREACSQEAGLISSRMLMKSLPYLALHYHAWDEDHRLALQYLDTLEQYTGTFYGSKYRPVLSLLAETPVIPSAEPLIEMPFSWCGPGMGYCLIDSKGDSIKIEVDTGTGYGLLTIHDLVKGQQVAGLDLLTVPDGIQYNYMDGPRDLHYKSMELAQPDYRQMIFGYFDGKFSKADGCASPFIFTRHALHIDPIRQKVWLRNQENLAAFLEENKGRTDIIPYQVRNGWIFIPCKVNGREVNMMIETGSRDVNLNKLSVDYLGVEPYDGFLRWNGSDYPVQKVDFTLEIGSISYPVKGGLVSDFVLGNWYYGVASAGDIGPDFLRHHAFIIDPFHQHFILIH